MKRVLYTILFIFTIISVVNGANLTNFDIKDSGDSVELTLEFDDKFSGEIYKTKNGFQLKDVKTSEKFSNKLNSNMIRNITIQGANYDTFIIIDGISSLKSTANTINSDTTLSFTFIDELNPPKPKISPDLSKKSEKKDSGFSFGDFIFGLLFILFIFAIAFFVMRKFRKRSSENFSDLKFDGLNLDGESQNKADSQTRSDKLSDGENLDSSDDTENFINESIKIIYSTKISDKKELILLSKDGKAYISFLGKNSEIPAEIYDSMVSDRDKFDEFIEICKNQNRNHDE